MTELDVDRLTRLAVAYQESRVLLTAVELDLFSHLSLAPMAANALAAEQNWDARALAALLDALVVMGLVEKSLDRYCIASANHALLAEADERGVIAALRCAAPSFRAWSGLTEKVLGGAGLPSLDPARSIAASSLAADTKLASTIAALLKPEAGNSFLDVGSRSAAYTTAFLARDRSLQATLLVEPAIRDAIEEQLRASEDIDAVRLVAADPSAADWPEEPHLVFLSGMVNHCGISAFQRICRRALDVLAPGGRLVIRDHIMSENRLRPRAGVFLELQHLVHGTEGRAYSFSELKATLVQVGFCSVQLLQDGEWMNGIVQAYKPS